MNAWGLLFCVAMTAGCSATVVQSVPAAPRRCGVEAPSTISGQIRDRKTGEPVPDALIVLESAALDGPRETMSNGDGFYAFRGLSPGTYSVRVLYGMDDIDEIATVTAGAEFHANFKTSPGKFLRCGPFRSGPALDESLFSITDKSEARLLGVPKTTYGR